MAQAETPVWKSPCLRVAALRLTARLPVFSYGHRRLVRPHRI